MMTRITLLCLVVLASCTPKPNHQRLLLLKGQWQIEGLDHYETWRLGQNQTLLNGKSFKISKGQEVLIETLQVKQEADQVVYYATVVNQNQGQPIPFVWNQAIADTLVFENFTHDFPNRILYYPLGPDALQVTVADKASKGFGYTLQRLEAE